MTVFQLANPLDMTLDRMDHVWSKRKGMRYWRCVLCGACADCPPPYPTSLFYTPDRYDKLTDEDRKLSPFPGAKKCVGK